MKIEKNSLFKKALAGLCENMEKQIQKQYEIL